MTVNAIIFDMDGVLIDSEPLWKQAGVEIFNAFDLPATWADMVALTGLPSRGIVDKIYQKYHKAPLPAEEMASRLNEHAIALILDQKPLMKGVKETLEKLTALGYRLAVASASPRKLLEEITQRCDIAQYFDYLSSATELAYNKPHPQVYLHAADMLNSAPCNCLGIEDSVVGMTAVKAASMKCIVIPDQSMKTDPRWSLADAQLNALSDINRQLIEKLGD
ncbi:hexitol phosphatase HxpB [Necropsobacter massiliensis]|uniref:hexitol phosphatase HxpB n=1 Tax=Necropsobacter massiliensis TaxID=1400001 RepID=UPI000595D6B7|nr:hexitol phosphatase HxpB [Necropsobacter massiliensis]